MASVIPLAGRADVGAGCHVWLPDRGGWGMSNAGLVVGRGESLLVDTLYDLRLTRAMLDALAPVTVAAPIATVVNTHGNGDHWFGNQLVAQAEIIAARGSLADMRQVGPSEMRQLSAAQGLTGRFARRIFGAFDHTDIEPVLPGRVFDGELVLDVGGTEVRLVDVGPAHSSGDTIVHVPRAGVVYTGDIVFAGAAPVVWHGPFANWLAACDLLLGLDAHTIVPGHGDRSPPRRPSGTSATTSNSSTSRPPPGSPPDCPPWTPHATSASGASPGWTRANASPSTCTPSTGNSTPPCPRSTAPACSGAWPNSPARTPVSDS
ncbi:MBL fold metallo-hydrolase [Streptomyces sp. GLT-R25]